MEKTNAEQIVYTFEQIRRLNRELTALGATLLHLPSQLRSKAVRILEPVSKRVNYRSEAPRALQSQHKLIPEQLYLWTMLGVSLDKSIQFVAPPRGSNPRHGYTQP